MRSPRTTSTIPASLEVRDHLLLSPHRAPRHHPCCERAQSLSDGRAILRLVLSIAYRSPSPIGQSECAPFEGSPRNRPAPSGLPAGSSSASPVLLSRIS